MVRPATLATVPDEGAVDLIRAALEEAGIEVEVKRLYPHPYAVSALATPFALRVPPASLDAARGVLARLSEELGEEVVAQAAVGAEPEPVVLPRGVERSERRLRWALALGLVVPVPVVCFYAGAHRLGALLLGVFVTVFAWPFASAWAGLVAPNRPREGMLILALAVVVRLADLVIGLVLLAHRRRRAASA
jgi:hypothetical protein